MKNFTTIKIFFLSVAVLFILLFSAFNIVSVAFAENKMPFYHLNPQDIVLRAEFSTDYSKSSAERKHNIGLAAKALNDTFIDVLGEFSFNKKVGARTEKRGYKSAKIIVGGEFVEGVGGGVCQVSTTLYNAALLSGLTITEAHAHSLSVSYVKPSFDAMVNSGSADLRFINKTSNPIIIKARADGTKLTVKILGEPMKESYSCESVIKAETEPEYKTVIDEKGEYPDLYQGERRTVKYGKKGVVSEGYLIKKVGGKTVWKKRIRKDSYLAIGGVIVEGTAIRRELGADVGDTLFG